jgi:outer membrane receptor protein involved in Fe transport
MNTFTYDEIDEQNLNAWFQQEFVFSPKIRMVWGLRQDYFTFSKDDREGSEPDSINGLPHGSGYAHRSVFSPKVNFIFSLAGNIDLFLNFGQGFHSNDARAAVMQTTGTLPKATAGEIGLKGRLFNKLHLSLAGWYLYLDKEFVYSGDGGTTELSDPTQRFGADVEARLSILSWLWADLDVSVAKATIRNLPEDQNFVPLAPTLTVSGGINIIRDHGFSGSIRFRHLSDRPANEDNSIVATGHTLFNASIAYTLRQFTIAIYGENLLNIEWNEAQFATETRLEGENAGITDLCFTPGNPINFQFGISYKF